MEISKIEINAYKIPLPEPVEAFAAGVMKAFDLVVCKIINDDGSNLSRIVALKRFLLYLLLSALGMLWILFDRENKCLPDRILKLKIVKRKNAS